jgi:hypothetical protein
MFPPRPRQKGRLVPEDIESSSSTPVHKIGWFWISVVGARVATARRGDGRPGEIRRQSPSIDDLRI